MLNLVKARIQSFGYTWNDTDDMILSFAVQKVENLICNDCNVSSVPDGLLFVAVDMAAGEFLWEKKTFSPESLTGIDLDTAVKQVQMGDMNTVFAVGEGSLTPEQRLEQFIAYLLENGREQLSAYRKLRW